jgi:catechol 2,3-dioxygenase-like lactoylglutathione lyase family enzyme
MLKFDHLRLPVTDLVRSRDWYIRTLAIFLQQAPAALTPGGCALWFQVDDVDATFEAWTARGVQFGHGPRTSYWGYGAELVDPDGYLIRLWDERSLKAAS